jgi:hypothetical protein
MLPQHPLGKAGVHEHASGHICTLCATDDEEEAFGVKERDITGSQRVEPFFPAGGAGRPGDRTRTARLDER